MNDAERTAAGAPMYSPADFLVETMHDCRKTIPSLSPEQLIAACGLALLGVIVLTGSNYSLSLTKGDFRLDFRPAC